MERFEIPIDFNSISQKTGIKKGRIFYSKTLNHWVVCGHCNIDMIYIDPPQHDGKLPDKIENNNWVYNKQIRWNT